MEYFLYFCKLLECKRTELHFMWNKIVVVCFIMCCVFANRASAQTVQEEDNAVSALDSAVRDFFAKGRDSYRQGEYAEAAVFFSKVIALSPSVAAAYNGRGSCYRRLGQYSDALVDYTVAISKHPCAAYYCNRGTVRMKMEEYDAAISDYTLAYAMDSTYTLALNNRGIVYLTTGLYRRAVEDFSACISINPTHYLFYNNRGIAYYKLKEFELSLADFDRTISLKPDYGVAFLHRGNIKDMLDNMSGACEDWNRAAELGVRQAENCLKNCSN